MAATISIVITTYNRDRYLGAAIASVLQQTYPNLELLIWDDGSTDQSLEIAQYYATKDARVQVVAAPHQGRGPALQQAIARTSGAYLGWVDDDDVLAPTALEETLAVLQAAPTVGMVYTDYVDMREDSTVLGYGTRCAIPYSPERLLIDFMTFHFRLMRRSVYEQVGGVDATLGMVEDYDLCLRLSEVTSIHHLARPLYYYRHHPHCLSYQRRAQQIERSRWTIAQALHRRGLATDWEIAVQHERFSLRRKARLPLPAAGLLLATVPLIGAIEHPAQATTAGTHLLPQLGAANRLTAPPTNTPLAAPPELSLPEFSRPVLLAQAITPTADGTGTIVTPAGDRLNISGGQRSRDGSNLFHSFSQFGLDANQVANFLSNPQTQNILGRVVGGNASLINGLVQVTGSNANLFLMNPAGIVFGPNARLDVAGAFTATTATGIGFGSGQFQAVGTPSYADLVGNPTSFAFNLSQPGAIVNAGNLAVGTGQSLSLVGGTVVNTGQLTAPGGQVLLSAVPGTSLVRVSQPGSPLSLEIEPASGNPALLTPLALPELLTGKAGELATGLKTTQGQVQLVATGSTLPTAPGTTIAAGSVDASSPTQVGGTVAVLGDRVGVFNASLGASGALGGGTILVGGDFQGKGTVPNALRTYVSPESTLSANALLAGDGGKVVVWADSTTAFHGTIVARGGATAGNGGLAEVSGKQTLLFRGSADLNAPNGSLGTLLLDPFDIRIVPGSGAANDGEVTDSRVLEGDSGSASFTISQNALQTLSGAANVVLEATNDIRIGPLGRFPIGLIRVLATESADGYTPGTLTFQPGPGSITFRADANNGGSGDFIMEEPRDSIVTNGRRIDISGVGVVTGTIQSNGAPINIVATAGGGYGSASTLENLISQGGDITITSNDLITVRGANAGTGNIRITTAELELPGGANSIVGTGNLVIQPFTTSQNIALGFGEPPGVDLHLNTADLDAIAGGFQSLTIGRSDSTGQINVLSDITLKPPTILVANSTRLDDGVDITALSQNLTFNSEVIQSGLTSFLDLGTGTVQFNRPIRSLEALYIDGNAVFNAAVGTEIPETPGPVPFFTNALTISGTTSLNGGLVRTVGDQVYLGAVTLGADTTLTGHSLDFSSTIQSDSALTPRSLTLNSNTLEVGYVEGPGGMSPGTVFLQGTIGGNNSPLSRLVVNGEGETRLGANVTAVGNTVIFNTPVVLTADSVITDAGNTGVTFNNTVDSDGLGRSLSVIANNGTVTFAQPVGGNSILRSLSVTAVGNVTTNAVTTSDAITLTGAGITTGTLATFGDRVTLTATSGITAGNIFTDGGGATLTTANGNILTNTISGNGYGGSIFVTANNGTVTTGTLNASTILTGANGGEVRVDAAGTVTIGDTTSTSAGNGGNITVNSANGAIDASNSRFNSSSLNGNGGAITLTAAGNITTGQDFFLEGVDFAVDSRAIASNGNGGPITFTSRTGSIDTRAGTLISTAANGNGGPITLTAAGNVFTGTIASGSNGAGTGGAITLTSSAGSIDTTVGVAPLAGGILLSGSTAGTGGAITLRAAGAIATNALASLSLSGTGGAINLAAGSNIRVGDGRFGSQAAGRGGALTANAPGTIDLSAGSLFDPGGADIVIGNLAAPNSLLLLNTIDTEGGSITATVAGDFNLSSEIATQGGNFSFTSPGALTVTDSVTTLGGRITLNGGTIDSRFGILDSSFDEGNGGAIQLTTNGNLAAGILFSGSVQARGGDITLTSRNGAIDTRTGLSVSAAELNALVDEFSFQGVEGLTGLLLAGSVLGDGGTIRLSAPGSIATGNLIAASIRARGGDVTVESRTGSIDASAGRTFNASGEGLVKTFTGIDSSSLSGVGGTIALTSPTGSVVTSDIQSAGGLQGGAVNVVARDRIQTGRINSSASIGSGGAVTLDPTGDVQVNLINAQGGPQGVGGNVDITTDRFFRATESFVDQNNRSASISTAGGQTGGTIIIRHGGGNAAVPFEVGRGTVNGTAGAITNGNESNGTIAPFRAFPGSHRQDENRIQILTQDRLVAPPENKPVEPIPFGTSGGATQLPCLDSALSSLDEDFTSEYEKYLGANSTGGNRNLGDSCATLTNIESETGIRPALIYVAFVPGTPTAAGKSLEQDEDELEIIMVTAKDKPVRKRMAGVTRSQVMTMADEFRRQVSDARKTRTKTYLKPAQALYQLLIGSIEAELQARKVQNLAFILDAGLRSLPIAAMHDGNNFLVEKYSLGLLPSLNLTDTRYVNIRTAKVLAAGASEFSDLNSLPAVPAELQMLKQSWQATAFLNEEFTENNLKAARQQQPFGIVHLATHGEFRPGSPDQSFIRLGDTPLRLDQLSTLGLNDPPTQLLVLSACRTALGDRDAELGFAGIAVQSGSKSALGSLWYVSDIGTLALMSEFYQQLQQAPIKAEALRQAQIAMLKGEVRFEDGQLRGLKQTIPLPESLVGSESNNLSHPFFWAPFTMVGSPW